MSLSRQDVEKVALLARLRLAEPELEKLTDQLNQIVGYVESLQQLDTEGVPPMAHPLPLENVFREDEVRPSLGAEIALRVAPKQDDSFYLVPPVLD